MSIMMWVIKKHEFVLIKIGVTLFGAMRQLDIPTFPSKYLIMYNWKLILKNSILMKVDSIQMQDGSTIWRNQQMIIIVKMKRRDYLSTN